MNNEEAYIFFTTQKNKTIKFLLLFLRVTPPIQFKPHIIEILSCIGTNQCVYK